MQSVSSRIWTRVAVSISYDNNHYTTGIYFFNGLSILHWLIKSLLDIFVSASYLTQGQWPEGRL